MYALDVCVDLCAPTKHERGQIAGWPKRFVVPHGPEWCLGDGNGQFDAHSVFVLAWAFGPLVYLSYAYNKRVFVTTFRNETAFYSVDI